MSFAAIIVASGSSRRMGFDKLTASLGGQPVLWHSVHAFLALAEISQIIVVTTPERFALLPNSDKKIERIDGGNERSDSVAAGLNALHPSITHVAIHDGARPLVQSTEIRATFDTATQTGAAALARPVTETLKRATPAGLTTETVSRDHLWIMETPQVFARDLIQRAYQKVTQGDAQITDEVSALQLLGLATTLVQNPHPNPKITVPSDLHLAQLLLSSNNL